MPQHIIEKFRHVFHTTTPIGNPDLPALPSVQAKPLRGGDEDKNGRIIVQNNQIFITPPLPGGKPAVISSVHPVVLNINRKTVTDPTEVTPTDRITWEICEKPQYQITVSEDKLKVYFTLYRAEKYAWKLASSPAAADVTVRAEPNCGLLLSTLTVDQIIAGFKKSSIMRDLNIPALYAELNNPTYLPVCIAEGKAPIPGKNARLELLFAEDREYEFIRTADPADFPNHPRVPFVQEGEVIACKLPAEEGVPGIDVYGGIIPSPPPQDIQLVTKECTTLLADGGIVSLRQGRPRLTGCGLNRKVFDFPQTYLVPGDTDPEAAKMMFPGDVVATNDIGNQTILEALGNVYIYGDVTHATITATGSIFVQGKVVSSQLYSGHYGARHNRLCMYSALLMEEMTSLRKASQQLANTVQSRQQTVKYGLVVMLLLESKYDHLPGLISDLQDVIAGMNPDYPIDTGQLRHMLEVFLHPGQFTDFFTDAVLSTFLRLLQDLHDAISGMQEENTQIDIASSQHSIIKSGGDLHVHKEGILHSQLFSSGDVRFVMNEAECTDSSVEAAGSISAQTVGKQSSEKSVLTAGNNITVRKICNSEVTIGEYTAKIDGTDEELVFTAQSLRLRNQAH
ncbi:hypothetical protein H70357_33595 [Paenibacillus sp. FSL H7-0357]|uniref:flagellar assembly protein A n=1 Tax=unclassified Paenibacillus TaxID=185978 RepID=UPI0004F70288|nr:flagellar assembly protein A [Paenibacillus sp. FSL H7-0357]AIQ21065.1 hypothetical protein H70357_33595 [Paenibacillus sp. FSL H7-0357]